MIKDQLNLVIKTTHPCTHWVGGTAQHDLVGRLLPQKLVRDISVEQESVLVLANDTGEPWPHDESDATQNWGMERLYKVVSDVYLSEWFGSGL